MTESTVEPNLTGVPETMLWTLHNRAAEAARPDAYLQDPACLRAYRSIDYDFERSFGKPDDSHPMRSRIFDDALRPWLRDNPGASVVELGAGLETQFQRCDDGHVRWLCVDVPEGIAIRERFFPETERCRYVRSSALDHGWMDAVDHAGPVFVSAQGLFMYFHEEEVAALVRAMAERFTTFDLMFDTIPPWFSAKTKKGFSKTRSYLAPPMPWGVTRSEVADKLRAWAARPSDVTHRSYGKERGLGGLALKLFGSLPVLRNVPPAIVHLRCPPRP